jgi:hypothetical protein
MGNQSPALIREALVIGVIEAQARIVIGTRRVAGWSRRLRFNLALAGFGAMALVASSAAYGATDGCNSEAAGKLIDFIKSAANFMIAIGAAGALLMLAVGAGFIIFAGGKSERAAKGMGIIKNCVIGLVILGAGVFLKMIVTTFVEGATGGGGGSNCIDKDSTKL